MAKISREEFSKTYKKNIEPLLGDLEVERVEVQKKCKPLIALVVTFLILFLLCLFILRTNVSNTFGVICLIVALVLCWPIYSLTSKLRAKLKQNVISKILSIYGNIYFAGEKDIIKAYEIRQMGLFPRFTLKDDDDIIIGVHKNCNFVICETKLTHREKRGKSSVTVTDFQGLIIKAQMNKNFAAKTVIGMKGYINKPDRNFEKVELESVDFMKNRCVYSTDQIDARYILTTSFIERLDALGRDFQEKRTGKTNFWADYWKTGFGLVDKYIESVTNSYSSVSAAFIDGYAYLFVRTCEDFFEIPTDKSLFNEELYYNICTELDSILGIIEYLHLDQKTGL